jgi:glycosidase
MKRGVLFLLVLLLSLQPLGAMARPQMHVAGTFNNWDPAADSGKMVLKDQNWECRVFLHTGLVEYKFVADGGWAKNWGDDQEVNKLPQKGKAEKGAGNIAVAIEMSGQYRFRFSPETGEYEVTRDESPGPEPVPGPTPTPEPAPEPTPPAPVPSPTGKDFREETIYFLITTRFYDGDPDNNFYNRDRIKKGDPHWRGDFKGLIEQLDYIRDLGFTAVWITPPVENRSGLDYHGYHAFDWTRIDPRNESPGATYKDLIAACHSRGLKLIQDVVVNHSSNYGIRGKVWINRLPVKYFRKPGLKLDWPYTGNLGNYQHPFRMDNDNPVAPAWFRDRMTSDPEGVEPLVDPVTKQTVPSEKVSPERFFGTDAQALDPEWFHLNGFMSGGDWESPGSLQTKHMAGDCIDLATGRQNVRDYLNGAIRTYLDMGVDAIRLDTVKHLERGDLLSYVNNWKKHKPGLFVFGENLVKGHGWGDLGGDNGPSQIRPWWYTRLGNDPRDPNSGTDSGFSVLDFSLFSTFRDNLSRGSFGGIGSVLSMDWVYGDVTKLVTFLQNHDVGPDNDFKYRFKGDDWMAACAYNLLWTIRGIPCLYYGEEIAFQKGLPQDICGNEDTLDQTGRAYFGDHLTPGTIAKTKKHPLWKHIQRLNMIRRAVPALQKAPMSKVSEWGSGMCFVRDWNNGESYAVVGLAAGGDQQITVVGIRNGTYRDAVTGNTVQVGNGSLSFQVKGNSVGIFVLNGPGRIGKDGEFLR